MNKGLLIISLILIASNFGCKEEDPFDVEFKKAVKEIARRDTWPESPEKVSEAFWNARYKKNYSEMHILWPGSACLDWSEICIEDNDIKYVFGTAQIYRVNRDGELVEEADVPYASEGYFKEHGSHNLTMKLRALDTKRGKRWYLFSGN